MEDILSREQGQHVCAGRQMDQNQDHSLMMRYTFTDLP